MESSTQSQRIFGWVWKKVAEGDLRPGAVISESEIAETFQVSRTPIREALLRLEQEGVVSRTAGRIVVAGFSYSKAADLYVARAALEGMCAYLATEVASQSDLDALDTTLQLAHNSLIDARLEHVSSLNSTFHKQIQSLAASPFLSDSIQRIDLWIERYRHAAVTTFGRAETALAEHKHIVSLMRNGQPFEVERAMQLHIMGAGQAFIEAVRLFAGVDAETTASTSLEGFRQPPPTSEPE